jgi:hypothetical protein
MAGSTGPGVAGLIWPQRSLITNREVAGPGALEPELWAKLQFLSEPLCARCGTAFEIAVDPGRCAGCLANRRFTTGRAARSMATFRDLVLGLKYQGGATGFRCWGWMASVSGAGGC